MWTELLVVIARGLLQYYVEEYCTPAARRPRQERRKKGAKRAPKEAPRPATAEEPMHSAGWGPPKEASLVNLIKIETDEGTTIAAASFIGEENFGVTRVQRERQPGESRRVRRKTQPAAQVPAADAVATVRDKYYTDAVQRMREWGHAEHARQEAKAQRQAEEAEEAAQRSAPAYPPAPRVQVPRTRPAGTPPLAVSGLTTETLVLLELGEPLTYVCAAA